jgi:predicted phosphate transport protein (TIGR00153 family)
MPDFFRAPGADQLLLDLLEDYGRTIQRATTILRDLVRAYPERAELNEELVRCEREGDRIAHDIIHRLSRGAEGGTSRQAAARPFDIDDGYRLATALDDVVDDAEAAGDMLAVYRVDAPTDQANQLADILVDSGEQVALALRALRTGSDLSPFLVEIHRLENDGDRISRDAIASLFEEGVDPLFVIRWKDIYGALENAIDACETVAHNLEGIVLKRRR